MLAVVRSFKLTVMYHRNSTHQSNAYVAFTTEGPPSRASAPFKLWQVSHFNIATPPTSASLLAHLVASQDSNASGWCDTVLEACAHQTRPLSLVFSLPQRTPARASEKISLREARASG